MSDPRRQQFSHYLVIVYLFNMCIPSLPNKADFSMEHHHTAHNTTAQQLLSFQHLAWPAALTGWLGRELCRHSPLFLSMWYYYSPIYNSYL